MARKIEYHSLHLLFRLFAYLADKSGGWWVFVSPKLILGSLLLGLGVSNCQANKVSNPPKTLANNTKSVLVNSCASDSVEEMVFCYITEQMPIFPGGDGELMKYLSDNIRYPEVALKNKTQGKVILRFVITKVGTIRKVEVLRSLSPECDKEAIRVVKSLPKWIPGTQDGKHVDVWYTLPVAFKLK
jgi:TonB family protein